jgi:hypothetical protein
MTGDREEGLSEVVGVILMVVLVIGVAMVVASLFMGGTLFQQKSAFIASQAGMTEVTRGGQQVQLVSLLLKDGDPFHFAGMRGNVSGPTVLLKVMSPDGKILVPDAGSLSGPLYGKTLFIYPNSSRLSTQCDYIVSDRVPDGVLKDMIQGIWTIQLIDEDADLLISSDSRAEITKGSTSYSRVEGSPGLGCIYRADCTPLCPGGTPGGTTGTTAPPMNMTYRRFNGNGDFIEYPDDPSLAYTGDLSISMWIKPADLTSWKQLIGKGVQVSSSVEDKNYDLYLINKQLYFEWDDRVTNTHYHVMTNGDAVTTTANWSYVTMVVNNGVPAMYVNGIAQLFSYYQSNVPGQNPIANPAQYPQVNLKDNENPLIIGAQRSTSYPFYYKGDIGTFALYNRGLTAAEIQANENGYQA